MKVNTLLTLLFVSFLAVACGPKSGEMKSSDEGETQTEEVATDDKKVSADTEDQELNIVKMMRKTLDDKDFSMSDEQLAQVQQIIDEIGISKEQSSEDFKENVKMLRTRMYKEVFNDDQRKVFDDAGLKIAK